MINLFSAGKSWDDYLQTMYSIEALTREDIIEVANRYFTEDQLAVRKRFGRNRGEMLEAPGFAPILPPNRNERSEFAQRIIEEAAENPIVQPRTIDFENDAQIVEITPLVTLYASENPVNSVFRLRLNYRKGNRANNMVPFMSAYLNDLATDSLSRQDFQNGLRRLGGTVDFSSSDDAFTITIQGFDENIEPTLRYVAHFMEQVAPNRRALRRVASNQRIGRRAFRNEPMVVADALFNYAVHGQNSTFLTAPSAREIRRVGRDGLLDLFHEVIQTEVDIHYSGNLPVEKINELVVRYFNPENTVTQANNPIEIPLIQHDRPTVFVIDMPRARQAIIHAYTFTPAPIDYDFINASRIFNAYFGGGINSLMFQEIREFRSFAYFAASRFVRPGTVNRYNGSYLQSQLTTSSDKVIDAITVLDSLLKTMPIYPERITDAKQSLRNGINNNFPSFRNVSEHIASQKRQGFDECINRILLDALDEMDMDSIVDFYNRNIKEAVTVYVVVGNMRQVDMEKLEEFGEVRRLRVRDVVR
jgi:predicted Zn-dependent peptidase